MALSFKSFLDEEWEQWLKNAIESGELNLLTEQIFRQGFDGSIAPAALFPPSMLGAAPAGRWSEIPELLHPMLRRTLDVEMPPARRSNNNNNNDDDDNNDRDDDDGDNEATPSADAVAHTIEALRSRPNLSSSLRRYFMDDPHRIRVPWPRRTLRFAAARW